MIILGITGTIGAGKGTIVEYLVENKNYEHYSVRNFLIQIIEQQKLPVNRDSMVAIANDLRQLHGPAYIVAELYKIALKSGKNAIIESIRTPGEIELLRSKSNFYLLAVDAEPQVRYRRVLKRQSETDDITYDTFLDNEKREMESDDPNKQNISVCIKKADFVINNDDTRFKLYKQIDRFLKNINS